jgi:hypothetical protein
MKKLELKQMEEIEGGTWSWSGCLEGSETGFQLSETTEVLTGGWGAVAGIVGGCVFGGLTSD